jgi:DNA-binding NtrC family response regulator
MNSMLIVDDNQGVRVSLAKYLKSRNYHADEAASGREAMKKAAERSYDAILLDLIMPDVSGMELLVELKKIRPFSRVIMMTGFATRHNSVEAMKRGAYDYLEKPFDLAELDSVLQRCIQEARFEPTGEIPLQNS